MPKIFGSTEKMYEDEHSKVGVKRAKSPIPMLAPLLVGDKVEARYGGRSTWYGAKVIKIRNDGAACDLLYDDGDTELNVPFGKDRIRRKGDSKSKNRDWMYGRVIKFTYRKKIVGRRQIEKEEKKREIDEEEEDEENNVLVNGVKKNVDKKDEEKEMEKEDVENANETLRLAAFERIVDRLCIADVNSFFTEPVTSEIAPDYFKIVKYSMDLGTLRRCLEWFSKHKEVK